MSEEIRDAQLERIRAALRPILVDEALVAKASLGIKRGMDFLGMEELRSDSTLFDFEGKLRGVIQHFAADGLTRESYLKTAVRQPSLFCQRPETVVGNIEGVVQHFADAGLTRENYLKTAAKQPPLFTLRPAKAVGNIEGVVQHFTDDGLTHRDYLRAAAKRPQLFAQRPETVVGNIEGVVQYFAAAGLTRGGYLGAAAKEPPLFTLRPETVIGHINLIVDLYRQRLLTLPESTRGPPTETGAVLKFLTDNPKFLCLAEDNIALREIYAHVVQPPPSPTLLKRSREEVENELARALGHANQDELVPKIDPDANIGPHARNLLLRALVREGIVKGQLE